MKNISDKFYIGIDSGGTKCEILIVSGNEERKILYSKFYKGVHYSIAGVEQYSNAVCEFIKSSLSEAKLNLKNCIAIGAGVAGAREEKDRLNLEKSFRKKLNYKNILITTDAMTALYGAFEGDDGIILISGTGSVLYGLSNGYLTRVGGWGRIIGDEGSGYWIGKRALNLITKEFDKRKNEGSLLSKKLRKKFGITKENVNEKIFRKNIEIQSIAPVVIDLANKKCDVSLKIVNEAVDGLIEHIVTFLEVSGRKKNIKIAFIGSIIENKNLLSDNLQKKIRKLKIVEVVTKKHLPAFGAVLLAMENSDITKKL
ncbi:MAG: BadF/BadG/BcrA/BcrD ATPase family protein [bacterium]